MNTRKAVAQFLSYSASSVEGKWVCLKEPCSDGGYVGLGHVLSPGLIGTEYTDWYDIECLIEVLQSELKTARRLLTRVLAESEAA